MKKNLMILLISITFTITSYSQIGKVKGKVVDNSDNHPLTGAVVEVRNKLDSNLVVGKIADKNGDVLFDNLQNGEYYLKISSVGYYPKVVDLALNSSTKIKDIGLIQMNINPTVTDNIVVEADKPNVQYSAGKTIVNVDKDIVNSNGTAFDILKNTPSVEVGADGQVKLRGSSNFRILIDGKNPGGNASDPGALLKQIPASILENIEIITNPSSKYDAEGSGGIINLLVKRKTDDGFNGLVMGNVGTEDRYNASLNFNYKKDFANIFGNVNLQREINTNTQNLIRDSYYADGTKKLILDSKNQGQHFVSTVKLGSDFFIDKSNKLTLYGNIRQVSQNQKAGMLYNNYINGTRSELIERDMNLTQPNNNFDIVANYTKDFEESGVKLTVDGNYSKWNLDMENLFNQKKFIVETNPEQPIIINQKNTSLANINYYALQSDLVIPISEQSQIEAGIKAELNSFDTDNELYNSSFPNNEWQKDTTFSVFFKNSEDIYAAYLQWSDKFNNFDYSLGIRSELTNHNSKVEKINYVDKRDYVDFFPSISMSYTIDEVNQLQLSYSSRIGRPQAFSYMPVKHIKDPFNVIIGNPELKPEYTDSYELGYFLSIGKHTFNPVVFYKSSKDNVFMSASLSPTDNIMYLTYSNDSDGEFIGTDFNYQGQLMPGLNLNLTFSYYNQIQNVQKDNYNYSNSEYTWDGRFSISYYMFNSLTIQINGTYYPDIVTPLGKRYGYEFVDLAIKYDFWERNGTLTFRTSDVFQSLEYGGFAKGIDYSFKNLYFPDSRHYTLGFSYKINNYQRKVDRGSGGTQIPAGDII